MASMILGLAALVVPRVAAAESEAALAETLFQEAKALLAKGAYAEACPKLAESQRLDPGDGTLLALALCHEGENKLAAAWSEYSAVANKSDARADRVHRAKERLAEIEPKLARVAIVVPDATSAGAPGLEIVRDGSVLGRAAWGTASPLEPGAHTVVARAPGKKSVRVEVTAMRGRTVDVVIPALDDAASRAENPHAAENPGSGSTSANDAQTSAGRPLRITGVALGGAGLAAIGVGAYFGLRAVSLSRDAEAGCASDGCAPDALRTNDQAKSAARVANFTVMGGAAALGGGVLLYLLAPKTTTRTALVPYGGVGSAGASLSTTF
jgi:hypothetical protein